MSIMDPPVLVRSRKAPAPLPVARKTPAAPIVPVVPEPEPERVEVREVVLGGGLFYKLVLKIIIWHESNIVHIEDRSIEGILSYSSEVLKLGRLRHWIHRLESGKYYQVRKTFQQNFSGPPRVCAIGVGLHEKYLPDRKMNPRVAEDFITSMGFPDCMYGVIISLNDRSYKSFQEIATFLRQFLPNQQEVLS